MNFEIRKLTREDIPAIAEIANQMPHYFQNILTNAEELMNDPHCYYYGSFEGNSLLGVGNFRRKLDILGWIESIRIAPENQRKGIGIALFEFGVKKAKEEKFQAVAYATDVNNRGSCRIGEKLGFKLITGMYPYWLENIDQSRTQIYHHKKLSIEDALNHLQKIVDGPKEEICIGWDFIPIKKSYFITQPNMEFYATDKAILLEVLEFDQEKNEPNHARAIIYGTESDAKELLSDFIARNKTFEFLGCFATERLKFLPRDLGFQPGIDTDGKQNKTLLWKLFLTK